MGYQESLNNCITAHAKASEIRTASPSTTKRLLLGESFGGTRSGISVTPESAMRTSAVWACWRVLAFSYASLPLHVYRDNPSGGSLLASDDPLYYLLHRAPNPEQTSFIFRQTAMVHLCGWGNAYAEIEFDPFGHPVALWPIPPWCCEPMRTLNTNELYYRVIIPGTGKSKDLQPYRILHIMGLGTDGMKGLSPIRLHAETIGVSIAATAFGGSFFGQGANVGGIVEHPGHLTTEGSTKLRSQLNEKYGGLGMAHRLMLLEEGMKYTKVGIPPEEAQFIETLQFHIEDIARIYGVQLHKIGHLLHATFSNIEQQNIEFVTDTMLPWVVNFEQEYDRKLCINGLYTKHSMEGLLRGDSASRAAFYKELFYMGAITPDQIREKEEMNPEPDGIGDRYYIQVNMIPADKIDTYLNMSSNKVTPPTRLILHQIAEKEKQGLVRAFKKNPDNFKEWLPEFYRGFADYVIKLTNPDYKQRYIEQSQKLLIETDLSKLEGWVNMRMMANCKNYKSGAADIAQCAADKDGIFQENCGAECPLFNGG